MCLIPGLPFGALDANERRKLGFGFFVNAMVNEGKLVSGTVTENTLYTSDGDYAYFDISVIDKDSIEHIYLTYKFQFSSRTDE